MFKLNYSEKAIFEKIKKEKCKKVHIICKSLLVMTKTEFYKNIYLIKKKKYYSKIRKYRFFRFIYS